MVCTALPTDMGDSRSLNYDPRSPLNATVKVEPVSFDLSHRLLRSPNSSSTRSSSTIGYPAPTPRCKRKASDSSRAELSVMTHPYASWPSPGLKSDQTSGQRSYTSAMHHTGSNRRGGSGDQQSYPFPEYSQREQYPSEGARHTPANAMITVSSLSSPVADPGMSQHSPSTASPSGMAWTSSPTSGFPGGYLVVPDDGNPSPYIASPDSTHSAFVPYQPYNSPYSMSEPSLQHPSGLPSPTGYSDHVGYSQSRNTIIHSLHMPLSESPLTIQPGLTPPPSAEDNVPSIRISSRPSQDRMEEEVRRLRSRIRDLEIANHTATERVEQLQLELAHTTYRSYPSTSSSGGLPSPPPSSATSISFEEGWRTRTEARRKLFCSLNRAGNALCAWHDSRRERRAHPPRMAPPGHLNCGCTYDEALFEESLARHGVGSYHPGESVRMDPALRNPLLRLLQQRYGYRDGDFERNPLTGDWLDDEGPVKWEAKAAAGVSSIKRGRGDERR